nr:MAG TPA: tail protein [Caudoviricetes sp.]DAU37806.1 MAG TPA: tail protein [Caudoviricetes sp.]
MYERLIYQNANGGEIEFSPRLATLYHTNAPKDVTGLRDVSAQVLTSSTLGQDGATYESSYIKSRDITIKGKIRTLNRDEQKRAMRELDHVLNPKVQGKLIYLYGDYRREIICYAETAPQYKAGASWPEYTIDLLCPSPFWLEATPSYEAISTWEGGFEFPLPDGLELAEGWEVGGRTENIIVTVQNAGDVECGVTVQFTALGAVSTPQILNIITGEYIKVNTSMQAADVIEVSTHYGNRKATLIRGDTRTNIFRLVDSGSTFFQMDVGANLFKVAAASGIADLDTTVIYSNQYLGV